MRRWRHNDSFSGVYWKWWMLRRGDCSMWIHEFERDYLSRDQFKSLTAQHWCNVSRAKKNKIKNTEHHQSEKSIPWTGWTVLLPLQQISSLNLIMLPSKLVSSAQARQDGPWHTRVERHCVDTARLNLPTGYAAAAAAAAARYDG